MLPTSCSKQDNDVRPSRGKNRGMESTPQNLPTRADCFGIIGGTLKDRILGGVEPGGCFQEPFLPLGLKTARREAKHYRRGCFL